MPLLGLDRQIEVPSAGTETRERRILAAIQKLEPQQGVESCRTRHIVGGQGDCTYAFDHRATPSLNYRPGETRP